MWECPAGQEVWQEVIRPWRTLGAWPDAVEAPWITAIFSLTGPTTPAALWKVPELKALKGGVESAAPLAHEVIDSVWRAQVSQALHAIWEWRHSNLPPASTMNVHACVVLVRRAAERRIHFDLMAAAFKTDGSRPGRTALLLALKGLFKHPPFNISTTPTLSDTAIVLFFDGGSRGNPGPGGAGAVLVRADKRGPHAEVLGWKRINGSKSNNKQQQNTEACSGGSKRLSRTSQVRYTSSAIPR